MSTPIAAPARRASIAGVGVAAACSALLVLPALLAPRTGSPGLALSSVLLVGTSMHVAATPWLFTVPDARRVAAAAPLRFLVIPLSLLGVGLALSSVLPTGSLEAVLLGLLTWQLVHFAKQNTGVVALCASACGVTGPTRPERRAIVATGWAGAAAIWANPHLVAVRLGGLGPGLYVAGPCVFAASLAVGVRALLRRPASQRPAGVVAVGVLALCFSAPLFASANPFAAAGGLALAHGAQYLALVGLVAAGPLSARRRWTRVAVLVNVSALGGLGLRAVSQLHGSLGASRALFGLYLGCYAAHFVVDAGLWRLSRPEARRFVLGALPFLSTRPAMDRATI